MRWIDVRAKKVQKNFLRARRTYVIRRRQGDEYELQFFAGLCERECGHGERERQRASRVEVCYSCDHCMRKIWILILIGCSSPSYRIGNTRELNKAWTNLRRLKSRVNAEPGRLGLSGIKISAWIPLPIHSREGKCDHSVRLQLVSGCDKQDDPNKHDDVRKRVCNTPDDHAKQIVQLAHRCGGYNDSVRKMLMDVPEEKNKNDLSIPLSYDRWCRLHCGWMSVWISRGTNCYRVPMGSSGVCTHISRINYLLSTYRGIIDKSRQGEFRWIHLWWTAMLASTLNHIWEMQGRHRMTDRLNVRTRLCTLQIRKDLPREIARRDNPARATRADASSREWNDGLTQDGKSVEKEDTKKKLHDFEWKIAEEEKGPSFSAISWYMMSRARMARINWTRIGRDPTYGAINPFVLFIAYPSTWLNG